MDGCLGAGLENKKVMILVRERMTRMFATFTTSAVLAILHGHENSVMSRPASGSECLTGIGVPLLEGGTSVPICKK